MSGNLWTVQFLTKLPEACLAVLLPEYDCMASYSAVDANVVVVVVVQPDAFPLAAGIHFPAEVEAGAGSLLLPLLLLPSVTREVIRTTPLAEPIVSQLEAPWRPVPLVGDAVLPSVTCEVIWTTHFAEPVAGQSEAPEEAGARA